MKKWLLLFTIAQMMLLPACYPIIDEQDAVPTELKFNVRVNQVVDTKAVKTDFVSNDVIYLFFNNVAINETPKYAKLTFDGTDWRGALEGGLTIADLAASGSTISAVFFPFGTVNIGYSSSKYVFTGADGLPIYTYYLSATADYTVETEGDFATLTATLNMTMPDNFVQFFVDKSEEKYNADFTYRLIVHKIFPVACASYSKPNATTGKFNENSLDSGEPMWGYAYNNEGIAFSGKIKGGWASAAEHRLIFFELGSPARTKVYSDKTLTSHAAIKLKVSSWDRAVSEPSSKFMGIYKNNDSNTGIKLYWADYNLGATTSANNTSSYGLYFAWGEIVPTELANSGDWFIKDENGSTHWYWYSNTKYGYGTGLKDRLDLQDDAANAYLGGDWRMPTAEEFKALWQGATASQFVQYNSDCRWKITRTVSGSSSTIYLAPAGFKYPGGTDSGNIGKYWTASYPKHICFKYTSGASIQVESVADVLTWHMPIRPVKEVPVTP